MTISIRCSTRTRRRFAGHTSAVMSVAFSPDGKRNRQRRLSTRRSKCGTPTSGQETFTLKGHTTPV